MSLYYEAEAALKNADKTGGSLKSRIFATKNAKHPAAQIYALLSPTLATLLVHDLLLSKRGIAAPKNHALNLTISRHQARLRAEFTKLRIRSGHASVEAFRAHVEQQAQEADSQGGARSPHPRWVRINTLRTTLLSQLSSTFCEYEKLQQLEDVLAAPSKSKVYHIDEHVPDLIALPPNHDLGRSDAYLNGKLIFQDKASCFPAVLLDPASIETGSVIDACAAPGNKTTHLAALMDAKSVMSGGGSIFAVERNASRSKILEKMVSQAGARNQVQMVNSTDFLSLSSGDQRFKDVKGILLDPSCSGSGIIGRDDGPALELPALPVINTPRNAVKTGSKRKRTTEVTPNASNEVEVVKDDEVDVLDQRLDSLSKFQLKLLLHAMSFPAAQRIVYSTCSIHMQENESVVIQALCSSIAIARGWISLVRDKQTAGLRSWDIRGDLAACQRLSTAEEFGKSGLDPGQIAQACIRCEKGTSKGTMGFFAAGFVKKDLVSASDDTTSKSDVDSEWEGFGE